MVTFQKVPQATLNVKTGEATGIAPKPAPPDIGMDVATFHQQVIQLAESKTPIEKTHQAIDQHPDITNKPLAKSMASAIYQILTKPGK